MGGVTQKRKIYENLLHTLSKMLIVAGEWTGATLNSEVNLLMQRKPFWFVLGFGLLCAESSMERDWPHVRPPQRHKRRKAWGGFPCDRWKRNPEQLEISGGFDVDTLSASDSVLAWDPVAEIWNGVGHLAEPRSKSPAFLSTKVLCSDTGTRSQRCN